MNCHLVLATLLVLVSLDHVMSQSCDEAGPETWDFSAVAARETSSKACPPINYYECDKYGSYIDKNSGCKTCCCPRINADCLAYGNYFDQNNCRHCCHPHSKKQCSMFGFYMNALRCKVCCPKYNMLDCQQFGYFLDANGCTVCCASKAGVVGRPSCKMGFTGPSSAA